MKTDLIREKFLRYFEDNKHVIKQSSSLVPASDPSLLFTNAGMVQFKNIFLGIDKPFASCAASSQRCLRAGGKHNDLDNVGYTARHHTFFEMLGNFSFGEYFKQDAIRLAWDFLTKELAIPEEKLWVTTYHTDAEAQSIWIDEIGLDPKRLSTCGDKDNFGRWVIQGHVGLVQKYSMTMALSSLGLHPVKIRRGSAMSRFGIWCLCSTIVRQVES